MSLLPPQGGGKAVGNNDTNIWGRQSNFSQPWTSVWDHICGTVWTKDDIEERYGKSRSNADKMIEHEGNITELKLNATVAK